MSGVNFRRLSESRPKNPISYFSGGPNSQTMLSSTRNSLLQFLPSNSLATLRATGKEARTAVSQVRLDNTGKVVKGSLEAWRKSFPKALSINLSGRVLTDDDFRYLAGVPNVNISYCKGFTDAAFVHLRGIHTLNMSDCRQITDTAFQHLRGITTLDMTSCSQASITDAAFQYLSGIHTLNMNFCDQQTITDAAFAHLRGIHTLHMLDCSQAGITDAAFANLRGIHTLSMGPRITDAVFVHLTGINTLVMRGCREVTDAAFQHLVGIHTLNMEYCNQATITDAIFPYLSGIYSLNVSGCDQLNSSKLSSLGCSLKILEVSGCSESLIRMALQIYGVTENSSNVTRCEVSQGGKRKTRGKKRYTKTRKLRKNQRG